MRCVLSATAAKQNMSFVGGGGSGVLLVVLLVLRSPWRFIRMRPFAMAVDGSKCLRTFFTVRCGNVCSWPFSMALINVSIGGQNKVWCMNLRACCLVGKVYAFNAWCVGLWVPVGFVLLVGSCCVGLMGRCHNLVLGSRGPSNTVLPSMVTLQTCLVNVNSHPLSQNWRVASNDVWESCGTICAAVILSGSHGMFKLHVCEDCMVLPSGNVMTMGLRAIRLLVTGALACRKCPVAPESEISMVAFVGRFVSS